MNVVSNSECIFDYYEIAGFYNPMIDFPPDKVVLNLILWNNL